MQGRVFLCCGRTTIALFVDVFIKFYAGSRSLRREQRAAFVRERRGPRAVLLKTNGARRAAAGREKKAACTHASKLYAGPVYPFLCPRTRFATKAGEGCCFPQFSQPCGRMSSSGPRCFITFQKLALFSLEECVEVGKFRCGKAGREVDILFGGERGGGGGGDLLMGRRNRRSYVDNPDKWLSLLGFAGSKRDHLCARSFFRR